MIRVLSKGFTLIETMTALFMVGIAILIAVIAISNIPVTREIQFENVALHVANTKLSELRVLGYDDIPASEAFTDPDLARLPQGTASTTVTDWNDHLKQVSVGVGWTGANGTGQYLSLVTLVGETGGL